MAHILARIQKIYSENLLNKIFNKSVPICVGIGAMVSCVNNVNGHMNLTGKNDFHILYHGPNIIYDIVQGICLGGICGIVTPLIIITTPITIPTTICAIGYHKFIKKE